MNEIKMDTRDAILGLFRQGWSRRRIARELGVHRKTVARHINLAEKESNCPINPTPGSDRPTSCWMLQRCSAEGGNSERR